MKKTKVDIVSGFLGAGKTTFIRELLAKGLKGEQIVLVENEFGEIGVDGGFLKDSGVEIQEMSQGCICCSLVGDFTESLREILTKYKPDRIIIEPSGVGKLSDVMKAIADVEKDLEVESNSAITIADVKKTKMYSKNFGEFYNNQIQFATTIILSRTDISGSAVVNDALEIIKALNPTAQIITTPVKLLSGEKLEAILESPIDLKTEMLAELPDEEEDHDDDHDEHEHDHDEHEEHGHHHHHHHHHHRGEHDADEIFESWGIEQAPKYSRDELEAVLNKLSESDEFGKILRAKGMVPTAQPDKWIYFDMVPGEIEIREGEPDLTGKICVIGEELNEDLLEKEFRDNAN